MFSNDLLANFLSTEVLICIQETWIWS